MAQLRETMMIKGKLYTVGVFGLVGLLVICYTVISSTGGDTGSYIQFAAPIATALVALMVISKQLDDVRSDVEVVKHQTNGQLAAQFEDVKAHIDVKVGETNGDA